MLLVGSAFQCIHTLCEAAVQFYCKIMFIRKLLFVAGALGEGFFLFIFLNVSVLMVEYILAPKDLSQLKGVLLSSI